MKLILYGFQGCGKTTYGKAAAEELSLPFIDSDTELEKKYGYSVRELYKALGQENFRGLEKGFLFSIPKDPPAILALGGGAVLDPETVAHLHTIGTFLYIKASKALIRERLLADLPAYLMGKDPAALFEVMYRERLPIYEALAQETIDTCQLNPKECLIDIAHSLSAHVVLGHIHK